MLAYGLLRLAGSPLPEVHISLVTVLLFCVVFFVGAIGEEIGWTGYALALVALWLMVPWWAALIFGGVWLVLLLAVGRGRADIRLRHPKRRWVRPVLFGFLGLYSLWQIGLSWQGRQLPAAPTVDLLFPLAAGASNWSAGSTAATPTA